MTEPAGSNSAPITLVLVVLALAAGAWLLFLIACAVLAIIVGHVGLLLGV